MKTQSAKSKGRRLQQKVAADIVKHFPALQEDDARSTSMGCGGEDVQLSPAARRCFPFSVECKNCEKLALWPSLQQCAANAGPGAAPLLVFKRNHSPTYAVLEWEQLLRLLPATYPPEAAAAEAASGGAAVASAAGASPQRKRKRNEEAQDVIVKNAYADIIRRIRQAEAELAQAAGGEGAPHG